MAGTVCSIAMTEKAAQRPWKTSLREGVVYELRAADGKHQGGTIMRASGSRKTGEQVQRP